MADNPSALDQRTFDALLSRLDADRTRAGEKYVEIRAKLVKIFECRGCWRAQELADKTIDRVARRLAHDVEIYASDSYHYFYGVALRILHEFWERPGTVSVEAGLAQLPLNSQAGGDQRLACLRRCVQALPAEERECILLYYHGEGRKQVEYRKKLAERLGISQNALRIHVCRIRHRLQTCVNRALAKRSLGSRWKTRINSNSL